MAICKNQIPLTTLQEWEKLAPPKGKDKHWCDGRSAKETARAWLEHGGTRMPAEVEAVLAGHPDFGPILEWQAEPEVKLPFDKFPGEPRNTDLLVKAVDARGLYLMAVEAKVDEPFGLMLGDALAAALDRLLANPRSNGILRIQQLAQALLGPRDQDAAPAKYVRYQLLTACAGVIAEAERRGSPRALMLVQEFMTAKSTDERHRQNAHDLDVFITRLSHGTVKSIKQNQICGPFTVPGIPLFAQSSTQLYIGKTQRNIC